MKRLATIFVAMLLLAIVPAQAASVAVTYVTELFGGEKQPASRVTFHGSCGDECYAASLVCDVDGGVNFTFADVEAKIAAKAITRKARNFTVNVNGVAYPFFITTLSYGGEMYDTWLVEGQVENSRAADFRGALAKATHFSSSIGSVVLTLPVTADVKTWATACVP